ncbi:hypothetical protein RHGRI_017724 [Rhododendron griersonianum]|uniref:PGG domain-containing protein n=1 Tax=Rhododendron griersonianum TaxID=479676 RepID=A0AAV6JYU5_9ERIC|nr:hypothetical protein RHGRI_017724 [Rhododendron griersonianum]
MSEPENPGLLEEGGEDESYAMAESMDPDLYRATTKGDILEFKKAREHGTLDRQYRSSAGGVQLDPQKNTVLHIATSCGHYEIVKLLCKDLPFYVAEKNSKGDTPLHIAARAGDSLLVTLLINCDWREGALELENEEGNTALHEALGHHHRKVAWILINKNPSAWYSVNKEGKSVLYLAAEAGFVDLVKLLMENPVGNCFVKGRIRNKSPVHAAIIGKNIASSKGQVDIIQAMLQHRPDSRELLTLKGQNIFHVAAKSGNVKAVGSMLKMPELGKLLNEKDHDGNTPLHIATIWGHPRIVDALSLDKRVNLDIENHDGLTALDIAEEYMEPMTSSRKRLTCMALRVAGAPQSPHAKVSKTRKTSRAGQNSETENYKDKVDAVLVVAALVVAATFTASFNVPGGYNNSNLDQGMATMLAKLKFKEFMICDIVAMYSSIIVIVTLLWALLVDLCSMKDALKLAVPLLGISIAMMSIAFMPGVYLVVSTLTWLGKVILVMGSNVVIVLAALFIPLCLLSSSNRWVFRQLSYFPFRLLLYAFGCYTDRDEKEDE